jgi:hypothetical protein
MYGETFDGLRLGLHAAIKEASSLEPDALGQIGLAFIEHGGEILAGLDILPATHTYEAISEARLCLLGMGDSRRCFAAGQAANHDIPSSPLSLVHHADAAMRLATIASQVGSPSDALTEKETLCHLEALAFSTAYLAGRAPGAEVPADRDVEVAWQVEYVQKFLAHLRFLYGATPSRDRLRTSLLAS